jgi:hypothetical protein
MPPNPKALDRYSGIFKQAGATSQFRGCVPAPGA